MATVAQAMETVAYACALTVPATWVASTQRTIVELRSILHIAAEELLDRIDWPDPITLETTLAGGSSSYSMPAGFKRLTFDEGAVFETSGTRRNCIPVTSNGDWTALNEFGTASGNRYYRQTGDEESGYELEFYQALETGASVVVSYVGKNWLKNAGIAAAEWTSDEDTLLLPKRLIELGTEWRWKQRKRLPFEAEYNEYEARVARAANQSRRKTVIRFGGYSDDRHPMRVPVPDYIPSA